MARVTRMTPIDVNAKLRNARDIIAADPANGNIAIEILQSLELADWDARLFQNDVAALAKEDIGMAIIYLYVSVTDEPLHIIDSVRAKIKPVVTRQMLYVNRLMKEGRDIGTLGILPNLVLNKIQGGVLGA